MEYAQRRLAADDAARMRELDRLCEADPIKPSRAHPEQSAHVLRLKGRPTLSLYFWHCGKPRQLVSQFAVTEREAAHVYLRRIVEDESERIAFVARSQEQSRQSRSRGGKHARAIQTARKLAAKQRMAQ